MRRNTAPCIAYGIFRIMAENPDAVIAVAPSDHLIKREDEFSNVMNEALTGITFWQSLCGVTLPHVLLMVSSG